MVRSVVRATTTVCPLASGFSSSAVTDPHQSRLPKELSAHTRAIHFIEVRSCEVLQKLQPKQQAPESPRSRNRDPGKRGSTE